MPTLDCFVVEMTTGDVVPSSSLRLVCIQTTKADECPEGAGGGEPSQAFGRDASEPVELTLESKKSRIMRSDTHAKLDATSSGRVSARALRHHRTIMLPQAGTRGGMEGRRRRFSAWCPNLRSLRSTQSCQMTASNPRQSDRLAYSLITRGVGVETALLEDHLLGFCSVESSRKITSSPV